MATVRAQEASSSSTSRYPYHVFLSFRGEDTRKTFADHLYTALEHSGFRTFIDDDGIERGENIKFELEKAIQESRISIVVFSRNYASSSWCLDELVMILQRNNSSGHLVLPVFYHVDPSHVRNQMGSFEEAFMRHEKSFKAKAGERKKEWKGKVEGWRAALREVADIAGMNLQNQADGHEAKFIQKITSVVEDKLSRTILDSPPHPIGIHSRAKNIQLWLQDGSTDVRVVAICGMGGIGKTTVAKFLYNLNLSRFEGSSFLANVREVSKQHDGLLRLQKQLLSDILKGRKEKIYNVDEGIVKIKEAICHKRVLVVLDDVDKHDQLEAVLGMRDSLFPGSRIIITTRHEQLLGVYKVCKVHKIDKLDCDESIELFSWHAFGQELPIDGYMEDSKKVVNHCGGLPLAIKILGASLCGKSLDVWKSYLEKLKEIPNNEIFEKLKISYDSLQDDHDKDLFLHVACFFVGKDKDCTVTILNGCDFHTRVGIQNLLDRCLLTIDERHKLVMHQLVQDMGREIVRQESPKEPGERSRLWNYNDSFYVLRENIGTRKIEGLILNKHLLKEDKYARTALGVNRKRCFEEFFDNSLFSNVGNSLKRYRFGLLTWHPVRTAPGNSNQVALETDAFARMCKLKLLKLRNVQINGSYERFPKTLRWLYWHGFPLQSVPNDFPLERMVALEMPSSSLKNVCDGTKFLEFLKILNLSHSHSLAETPDFSMLPNLERLQLENCASLVKVHESIGHLERLAMLNLKDCKSLRKLPKSIVMLKSLEILDISGCSNLEKLPIELENVESLKVFRADGTDMNQLIATTGEVREWYSLIRPWLLKPIKNPETSWASLPRTLVSISLASCNLSDEAFPRDISNLSSLRELNLSDNPICSLPDCIRGLTWLQTLCLQSCARLQSVVVEHELEILRIRDCKLLEKITSPSVPVSMGYVNCQNLVEIMGVHKLEPIGNVDAEIINNLGLSNLGSTGKRNVKLISPYMSMMLPLQGCHERYMFYAYIPGSKVPANWFNLKNTGSSIFFTVPSSSSHDDDDLNFRIRGLSVCSVYAFSNNERSNIPDYLFKSDCHTIISNTTKRLKWSHCPEFFGLPEAAVDEDMMWLSYWKFENPLKGGDELNIRVVTGEDFQVKEVGVHLVLCKEEQGEEKEDTSHGEAAPARDIHWYGKVIPTKPSESTTGGYCLGLHNLNCKYCPPGSCLEKLNRWVFRSVIMRPWAYHPLKPSAYPPPH